MKLLVTLLTVLSLSCGIKPPKPEPCSIINPDTAFCTPTNGDDEYDRPISRMRGYMCFSPDDVSDIQAFLEKVTGAIDKLKR